jgi:hypothetical protein
LHRSALEALDHLAFDSALLRDIATFVIERSY